MDTTLHTLADVGIMNNRRVWHGDITVTLLGTSLLMELIVWGIIIVLLYRRCGDTTVNLGLISYCNTGMRTVILQSEWN